MHENAVKKCKISFISEFLKLRWAIIKAIQRKFVRWYMKE